MMNRNGKFTALALASWALLAATPRAGGAQERIEPAPEIRVLEVVDRWTGRRSRAVVEDLTPAEILRVQVQLARAGHDPRSRSGVLDDATRRALISFQSARGLEICGCVTYETIVALGIVPEVVARIDDAGGAPGSTVFLDRREPVVILVPAHVHHHRHVGLGGPGIVVGHEPAVGAGQLFRRRFPSRPERRDVRPAPSAPGRDPRPIPPPGTGGRIRPGDRPSGPSAGGLRPARARP